MTTEAHLCKLTAAQKRENPGMTYAVQAATTDALGRREWHEGAYFFARKKTEAREGAKRRGWTPWNF